ncbi:hypothetical protein SELMODRAFT_426501 [Selaginella moellendorffii]|uniref:Uncharacterized protein n=1 Tax=Selaginella moellendorffii TaxID=88036 RepID=D8SWK1_SELML|nr:hypothetical protein SELMODRAFT_426501 [Selaginella moellendorffii]
MDFKNQSGQPFFSRHMAYRYLNHCSGRNLVCMSQSSIVPLRKSKNFVHGTWSCREALLEGVEMPQDRDEIHIEQTEDEKMENLAESSPAPSHPIMSKKPTSTLYADVCPLSLMGSVSNMVIVIGDYFQLSNNVFLQRLRKMMTLDWLSLHQATYLKHPGFSMELPCSLLLLLPSQYYTS